MSRIPASTTIALAVMLPTCAAALGLGEIQARSYLNQPLAAEIPVTADVADELAGLTVTLASPETFSQYGLPRPTFLGDLRFTVTEGSGGGVIRVTSTRPVAEPFVSLLLDVRWAQGRLLREFTVLLDPPDFASAAAVEQSVETPVAAPAEPVRAVPAVSPPPASGESAPVPPPAQAAAPRPGPADTHLVARNETLWGIAEQYRPDGADINQMMVSIYRANPEAFAGNINRLRAGAVLRIPEGSSVQGLGRADAATEVGRQNREWRGAAGTAAEAPARLELVPPPETAPATPPGETAARKDEALQAELEESRRQIQVRDAELKALRDRVAALEGEVAVEAEPAPTAPPVAPPADEGVTAETPAEAPAETPIERPAETAPPAAVAQPAPARPTPEKGPGLFSRIGDLLLSPWLWIPAALVLVGALFVARRRSGAEEPGTWTPPATRTGATRDAAEAGSASSTMIVHEEPARASGRFERRALARGDDELPLERTISTDAPVNLDQADPLAEADFHMAYGLYDQAADLLTAAVGREPGRRDLRLKLLDVFFVWENRDGFLKEARALRERIGNDADPDWKRVLIMGKQLCPNEALFAGAAAQEAAEMDLDLSGDSGGDVDLELGGDTGALDFDLGGDFASDVDTGAATRIAEPTWRGSTAQTQEIPTIEVPAFDTAVTRESPTVQNAALTSTIETPTIETRTGDSTMETPTMEVSHAAAGTGATARLHIPGADERADQTAEIDLEDLGLDLTGLDDAARDMATGLQEALPEDAASLDFDLSTGSASAEGEESTAEMEKGPPLTHLTNAISKSGVFKGVAESPEDTVEQPRTGGSPLSAELSATNDDLEALNLDIDFSVDPGAQSDLTATSLRAIGAKGPDDATMTEVGTKLDLARAYLDMGDPDGARSILNEVIDEGDPDQRQAARQLLDGLDS